MRDSAVEAGCYSIQHVKPNRYWCPELNKLRHRKQFWWNLWVDNGRPREWSVFSVYMDVNTHSGVDLGTTLLTRGGTSTINFMR